MGFWDREVRSSFDSMFDYDHDGYLNTSEQAMQFSYIEECERSEEGTVDIEKDDYGLLNFGSDSNHKKKDDLFGLDNDWDEFDSDF